MHFQTVRLPNSISCKVTLRVFGWCTLTICYPPISPRCSTPRCILAQSQILVLTTCCFHLGHIVPWLAGWTHWSEGWATPGEPSFNPRNRGLEGQGPPTTPSALGLPRNSLEIAKDFSILGCLHILQKRFHLVSQANISQIWRREEGFWVFIPPTFPHTARGWGHLCLPLLPIPPPMFPSPMSSNSSPPIPRFHPLCPPIPLLSAHYILSRT